MSIWQNRRTGKPAHTWLAAGHNDRHWMILLEAGASSAPSCSWLWQKHVQHGWWGNPPPHFDLKFHVPGGILYHPTRPDRASLYPAFARNWHPTSSLGFQPSLSPRVLSRQCWPHWRGPRSLAHCWPMTLTLEHAGICNDQGRVFSRGRPPGHRWPWMDSTYVLQPQPRQGSQAAHELSVVDGMDLRHSCNNWHDHSCAHADHRHWHDSKVDHSYDTGMTVHT